MPAFGDSLAEEQIGDVARYQRGPQGISYLTQPDRALVPLPSMLVARTQER